MILLTILYILCLRSHKGLSARCQFRLLLLQRTFLLCFSISSFPPICLSMCSQTCTGRSLMGKERSSLYWQVVFRLATILDFRVKNITLKCLIRNEAIHIERFRISLLHNKGETSTPWFPLANASEGALSSLFARVIFC